MRAPTTWVVIGLTLFECCVCFAPSRKSLDLGDTRLARQAVDRRRAPAVQRRDNTHQMNVLLMKKDAEDPTELLEKAKRLRQEVETFESRKMEEEMQFQKQKEAAVVQQQQRRERYSANVPILKPDGSTREERCDFLPRWPEGVSYILVVEAALPIGIVLGESEQFSETITVDNVGVESNGKAAGIQEGDLVRAFTACKVEMEMPTWQLLAGGIGVPRTRRFMYSADGRPFEEVMNAIASNRQDPEERPVLFVLERRENERG